MKKDINELLKHALTPTQEPDFWLNQKILNQIKETNRMDGKKMRRIPCRYCSSHCSSSHIRSRNSHSICSMEI